MRKRLNSEKGLSLLEVIASILLISIILLSFFGLFVQSKKTGAVSEEIVDATYLAQQEMENYYNLSKSKYLSTDPYEPKRVTIRKGNKTFNYTIDVSVEENFYYNNLRNILILVCEGVISDSNGDIKGCEETNRPIRSQLESIY